MNRPRYLLPILLAVALSGAVGGGADTPPSLRTYDTRYYQLHTDLPPSEAGQVGFRMTCMVEEYRARTRAFSGALHRKLPFYLFRDQEAYLRSGGLPGTAGVFKGHELLALAGERLTSATWTVIQHEAFHQFARQVIGGEPPVWVNEGLADYFGEALFTGDRFVTGLVPAFRLRRIQQAIGDGSLRPLEAMMRLSHDQWNADIQVRNYDQAWSMVYFLAHGDGGRYQAAFERYMGLIGRGHASDAAWGMAFGDSEGFERRWRDYWLSLPPDPTARQYVQASVEIYTRLLASAVAGGKAPPSTLAELVATAGAQEGALAAVVLADADNPSARLANWSIDAGGPDPRIVAVMPDGTRIIGSFTARGRRVTVKVQIDPAGNAE